MSLRKPVLILLRGVLQAPSLVGTPSHLYPSETRKSSTGEVLLVRSNHGALVRLVLQGRVVQRGDIHDLLASLLQQNGLLQITCPRSDHLIGSLVVRASNPSEPSRSNLRVVESPVPCGVFHPSMSA